MRRSEVACQRARAALLLFCALACGKSSAPPGAPAPSWVEPGSAYAGRDTPVLLHGDQFEPEVVQQLGSGSHLALDAGFRAFLGDAPLADLRFIDTRTLAAMVPASLAAGDYSLTVEGPYGSGTATGVFHLVQGNPASLSAAASAPARALIGQNITISVAVSNGGTTSALGVTAGAATTAGPPAVAQAPPGSVDISGGASHTFAWQAQASATGQLDLTLPVAGTDEVDGAAVTAQASASVLVVTPAHLTATPRPPPASEPAGPTFQIAVDVANDGGSDALGVTLDPLAGTAGIVQVVSAPLPQDVPAGTTRTFVWTIRAVAEGTAQLGCSGSGTDSTDGSTVAVAPAQWTPIVFDAVALLFPTLAVPPGVLPNETFSLTLTLANPGIVDALAVQLSSSASGAGTVSLQGAPSSADVPAGTSVTFVWTYKGQNSGQVRFDVVATGTDRRSGNPVSASDAARTVVAIAAPVATDPFGDGTPFAYVFAYANKVYVGPNTDGTSGVRMSYDGSAPETTRFAFITDPAGVMSSVSPLPATFPSLGYAGCTPDTLQCGPDDEDGRGLFTSVVLGNQEWLFAGGSRQTSTLKHTYLTTDVTAVPPFQYVGINPTGGSRGTTAAAAFNSALYVGLANAASGVPVLLKMSGFPADSTQPLSLSISDAQVPVAMTSPRTGLIDALFAFNGSLYAANDTGCFRYSGSAWGSCTPTATAWTAKTSISTSKTSDFVPADKAVPQLATFKGRLYMPRNTTAGPQLWSCNPSSNVCAPSNWTLLPNQTLDPTLTQMDNASLTTISLLAATSQHLYVGYDSPAGALLYQSKIDAPGNTGDFASVSGAGLGANLTQILDARALTVSTREFLYLVARAGAGTAQVYRLAP